MGISRGVEKQTVFPTSKTLYAPPHMCTLVYNLPSPHRHTAWNSQAVDENQFLLFLFGFFSQFYWIFMGMLAMRILEIEFSRIFNTKPQPVRQTAKVQENSNSEFFRANIRLEFWYCTFSDNTILKLPHFLREIQNSVNKKWTLSDF